MLDEENSYFKCVVKDALDDLKSNGSALVFSMEQVQAIREKYKGELEVIENDGFYRITRVKVIKEKKEVKSDN